MPECRRCGQSVPPEDTFCPRCGMSMTTLEMPHHSDPVNEMVSGTVLGCSILLLFGLFGMIMGAAAHDAWDMKYWHPPKPPMPIPLYQRPYAYVLWGSIVVPPMIVFGLSLALRHRLPARARGLLYSLGIGAVFFLGALAICR